ncbi:sugar phosphate isomerase/epimerase family protein [Clostridium thermosuccinogenes]|jgi:sugar phosphate isomerase/epimerase|uniref:sugar phosphate isomerase/epimerase family protein n=1 Tax=Clostridium thermosuccinogenes TaxID=84032 RepID=UPI000CCBE770|nr:sugar phosphate isomerase/epimerase [Pseudoclostridium thermosuccinogenes]PNT92811.1 xylose isomerase [Pseudoclostridium thermosuccinogenes]
MKLGVFTVVLADKNLEDALKYLSESGVQAVELGTGGYPSNVHANPDELLADENKLSAFKDTLKKYNMMISALSCHGNPVHPQKEIADAYHKVFEKTILLAEKLGIDRINTFSGCPGDAPGAKYPNWVTCPWPDDFLKILDYQWNEVLIPYWEKAVKFAKDHGVTKIGLEMHPGFCVYNPETLLKLRAAVGDVIGANFDPSHLIWQGADPVAAIRKLGPAIYHFHAKDTKIDKMNTAVNGVLDTKHYGDEINRSWIFRSVGYGNDYSFWKDIVSNLRMVGYDYVMSIEHEDSLMSGNEGLQKAISFLKEVMTFENVGGMWWA